MVPSGDYDVIAEDNSNQSDDNPQIDQEKHTPFSSDPRKCCGHWDDRKDCCCSAMVFR